MAVIDSYIESNADSNYIISISGTGFILAAGQSFTGDGNPVDAVRFYLKKSGSPTGTLTAYLYAHTGTFGTDGTPTGAALATSDTIDASTISTTQSLVTFTFSSPYTTVNTTKYFLVVAISGGSSDVTSNFIQVGRDNSSPTHGGNVTTSSDLSSWGSTSARDIIFYADTTDPTTTSTTSSSSSSSSTSSTSTSSTSSTSTSSTSSSTSSTSTSSSSSSTSSTSSSTSSTSSSTSSSSTSSTSSSSSTSTTLQPFRKPHIEIVLDDIQIDYGK